MPKAIVSEKLTCSNCGCEIKHRGSRAKNRDGTKCKNIYCCNDCYLDHVRRKRKEIAPKCKTCGELIDKRGVKPETVFCNKECMEDHASILAHKKCQVCGVGFCAIKYLKNKDGSKRIVKDKTKKCCSRLCLSRFMSEDEDRKGKVSRSGSDHHNWQGGLSGYRKGYRGPNWISIAEKCREIHGRVCKNCGKTEHENGRKLDVNHITPWHQMRDKVKANKQSNLEALCRSCHTRKDSKWRRENSRQMLMAF